MSGFADNSAAGVGRAFDFGEARCPRCGYDQRGVMAQWSESCPLMGRCAECGLDYWWAELLVPEKFEPSWCVEYARGFGRMVRSCFGTTRRALWPWVFWKRLTMSHEVRWRRIAVYWMFLFAVLLLCYVVQQTAVAVQVHRLTRQNLASYSSITQAQLVQAQQYIAELEALTFDENGETIEDGSGAWLWVDTEDDRDAQLAQMKQRLPALQAAVGRKPTLRHPMWKAVAEGVLTPWRSGSAGQVAIPMWGPQQYVAPRDLHFTLVLRYRTTGLNTDPSDVLAIWFLSLVITITLIVLIPIEFVLLPMSRKRAKVRWRHVWRVAAYSVSLPMSALWIALLGAGLLVVGPLQDTLLGLGSWWAIVPPLAVVAWWAAAIGRYMRIPRGWFIAPLFAVLSVLVLVAIVFWGGAMTQELLAG